MAKSQICYGAVKVISNAAKRCAVDEDRARLHTLQALATAAESASFRVVDEQKFSHFWQKPCRVAFALSARRKSYGCATSSKPKPRNHIISSWSCRHVVSI